MRGRQGVDRNRPGVSARPVAGAARDGNHRNCGGAGHCVAEHSDHVHGRCPRLGRAEAQQLCRRAHRGCH
eukprot:13042016-Alexandrium_andersonii.AAC.1